MSERWKDIPGYEGLYQASNLGRVKRLGGTPKTVNDRILNGHAIPTGYLQVFLYSDAEGIPHYVHRLVCAAFHGPPPTEKHEVNHLNGVRGDNRAGNLQWVTCSENHRHAYRVLGRKPPDTHGEASGMAKLSRRDVRRIREMYATGKYQQAELGRMFGVKRKTIWDIVHRHTWTHI